MSFRSYGFLVQFYTCTWSCSRTRVRKHSYTSTEKKHTHTRTHTWTLREVLLRITNDPIPFGELAVDGLGRRVVGSSCCSTWIRSKSYHRGEKVSRVAAVNRAMPNIVVGCIIEFVSGACRRKSMFRWWWTPKGTIRSPKRYKCRRWIGILKVNKREG